MKKTPLKQLSSEEEENVEGFTYPYAILPGNYPDPSLVRVGRDYYMTHSCGHNGPALQLWHSTNLMGWEPIGYALEEPEGDIWAPDICFHNGTFYIYYTQVGGNYCITARDPRGPWSKPVALSVPGIDPGHLCDKRGNRYLYLSDGYMAELSEDGLQVKTEARKVYDGWKYPEEWCVEGFCLEGPKLFYYNDYYYLTVAEGGTAGPATSHMAVTSRSKNVDGPWEHSPYNPVIKTWSSEEVWWSKGHATLIDDLNGDWWAVYHAYERNARTIGRQTLIEPIEWTDDGWFKTVTAKNTKIEKNPWFEANLSDDFHGKKLGWQWQCVNDHQHKVEYRVEDGAITIEGFGSSPQDGSVVVCKPVGTSYEATIRVTISKAAEAGLLLYYNSSCYFGLGMNREIVFPMALTSAFKGRADRMTSNTCEMRILNEQDELSFYYRSIGGMWQKVDLGWEVSGCHHNVLGGFGSLRIGLYVSGNGSATFQRFRYHPIDSKW
ncbi:family 43 glycosylhydrolase [Guptibacillus hwajinpoensis]|uniref:family 43 glycosylhydrolase n=1 Tax=Guptibacillus hwajinpoensis TaxID=208199 RepID=UPI001CD46EB2|nr:family 43 glycosylhydrolase [Pseudalkalibacillus hwajinpoensis]MCA0991362.1 family 43 glycosylhydrolase [Pseudalkalibacillus hwajinpoensis]